MMNWLPSRPFIHANAQPFLLGFMGLPLAFVALPLYVHLPHHFATQYQLSLAGLGFLLLGARLLDAVIDPWMGKRLDRLFSLANSSSQRVFRLLMGACLVLLCVCFWLLFAPPAFWYEHASKLYILIQLGITLMLAYLAFSFMSVAQQAWTARLPGDEVQRSHRVAWREALSLVGVVLASVLPSFLGLDKLAWLLPPLLLLAWFFFMRGQTSDSSAEPATIQRPASPSPVASWKAFANRDFRQLFTVFLLNGIASALPASLLLFFAQDVLRANEAQTSLFLLLYFVGSAVSIPLWLRVVRLAGLARSWLIGMLLAVVIFVATLALAAGDTTWFAGICCLSGLALGIDLIAPAAMLAGISQSNTDKEQSGLYFGWWHFASKLNLALAAGLALPILSLLGYVPGLSGGQALGPLHWAYAGLPCLLKSVAAGALWLYFLRPHERMMQLSAVNTQSGDIT